jgi:hypothetical protein
MMEFLDLMEPWMIPILAMICVTLIMAIVTIGNIIKNRMKQIIGMNITGNKEFLARIPFDRNRFARCLQ